MSKYWRVDYDKMQLFIAYVKAETEEEALKIAKTLEEDEMMELNPTWDGPHLSSVDADEALEHGIVFRPSEDE
jgi:hypothetical protein